MPVMIHTKYELPASNDLFSARAEVFSGRLGWQLSLSAVGERDHIDIAGEPIYFRYLDDKGSLRGSLRIISTIGDTVLSGPHGNDFLKLPAFASRHRFECSRFFVLKQNKRLDSAEIASELFAALCEYCLDNGIRSIIASFAPPMGRIYARLGWKPRILSRTKPGYPEAEVGLWRVSEQALQSIRSRTKQARRPSRRDSIEVASDSCTRCVSCKKSYCESLLKYA